MDRTAIKRPLPVEDPGLCKHYLLLPFAINSSSHMNCSIIIATGKHQNEGIGNRVRRSHTTTSAVMEERGLSRKREVQHVQTNNTDGSLLIRKKHK